MPINIKNVNYTHGKRSAPKHLQQNLQPLHYSTQNSYLNPEACIYKPNKKGTIIHVFISFKLTDVN